MISLREIDELRGNTERLLDTCHELAAQNRRLLDALENSKSTPKPKDNSTFMVHISRIADDIDKTILVQELEKDYGRVRSFKRGNFWLNIEFDSIESKRRCLDAKKELFDRLGITVQPHRPL